MASVGKVNQTDAYSPYASGVNERKTEGAVSKASDYGKTIGDAKLSEEGQKYYEQLKKKFGNYDFILVSEDQKANAQANASRYANKFKTVVLIDEEKIERMATDANYRKKYEAILSGAASQLQQLKSGMEQSGANVKGYGMQVNDGGTASFFAVLKKSSADQKARIEKKQAEKKADRKAAEKKAAKEAENEKREERIAESRSEQSDKKWYQDDWNDEDTIVITANSMEELLQKLGDYAQNERMNSLQTQEEQMVGQYIDFKG